MKALLKRITGPGLELADVPAPEQWACIGGAISNALNALHFMGFAGKMVAGARASDPAINAAYCAEGEVLLDGEGILAMDLPKLRRRSPSRPTSCSRISS